jgi:serine/threonine-protein kinase
MPLSDYDATTRGEPRALDLAIQIAEGLATAHEHGVVHRDLKPANTLLDVTVTRS